MRIKHLLDRHAFPISELCEEVPEADLYLDDKAWRLRGWEDLLDEVRGRFGKASGARIGFALVGALQAEDGEAVTGAVGALEALAELGLKRVVTLGNYRPDGEGGAERRARARAWLEEQGLPVEVVDERKVGCALYVDAHSEPFTGSWTDVLPRVLARLDALAQL